MTAFALIAGVVVWALGLLILVFFIDRKGRQRERRELEVKQREYPDIF